MRVIEKSVKIPVQQDSDILKCLVDGIQHQLGKNEIPIRFAITETDDFHYHCEVGVVQNPPSEREERLENHFKLRTRKLENTSQFNSVFLIPTGVGSELGGHAGDATAVAKMLAESCDQLVLHPNVVNASDINEMPENSLYVEGSIIDRMLLGSIGLQPIRSNRVLTVIDNHPVQHFVDVAINSVSAARATYGLNCPEVVSLRPSVEMHAEYSDSGCAVGRIEHLDHCLDVLLEKKDEYDAVALSSVIRVPFSYHTDYFKQEGEMINPWGGVEAMLTHTLSLLLDVPTAHAPMFENKNIENLEVGIVDPRMSAEAVSVAFLQCVLKGLHKAPRIIKDEALFARPDVLSVEDISCIVIPDGCLGLPIFAALEQGIKVIAVKENKNLMKNDLAKLPWKQGQFIQVENYLEASGVMNALKSGVTLESVRRPFSNTKFSKSRQENAFTIDKTA